MAQIQKTLPKEITDKYSIVSNAFRLNKIVNAELDEYKNEPKDEISVEIGDTKQTEFYPQAKISRWNEVNFSVRLKDTEYDKAIITTDKDKIVWDKDNTKIEFYEDTEGYKMVWYLKSKPATNKVEFSLQSKGLDFFYQPELTQEEMDDGAFRPENVVGSYAVYHSTKGGMNDKDGKDYKVGKAFHIYRPRLYDSNGLEAWGILHIENGIYSVEIPQDFLDNAIYPIKSNDTFGYDGVGGSNVSWQNGAMVSLGTPEFSGTVTKITGKNDCTSGTQYVKAVIWLKADGSIITNGITPAVSITGSSPASRDFTYSSQPSVVGSTEYYVGGIADSSNIRHYYDTGDAGDGGYSSNNYASPTSLGSLSVTNYKFTYYATYTPAAAGPANLKSVNGIAIANVASVNSIAKANIETINTVS